MLRSPACQKRRQRPRLAATQLHQDVLREAVSDLAMARDGLVNTRLGIAVPVMIGSGPGPLCRNGLPSSNPGVLGVQSLSENASCGLLAQLFSPLPVEERRVAGNTTSELPT